jgi:O-antigen/teichoic acid export membrane protein
LRERLLKGSAYTLLATVAGQAFALVTSILYARLLGPFNLGVLAIYAQLSSLLITIAALGLGAPITRFVARYRTQDPAKLGRLLSSTLVATLGATAVIGVATVTIARTIASDLYGSPELVAMFQLLAIFLALNSLSSFGLAILQGLQRIQRLSVVGIFLEALTIPVMFVALTWFGLVGVVLGGTFVLVVASVLLFGSARRELIREGIRLTIAFDRECLGEVASYALPLLVSALIMRVAFLVQASLLFLFLGFVGAGLFRVASIASRIVAYVPSSISIPLLPAMSELHGTNPENRSQAKLTTILRLTSYVGVPVALGVGLFAGVIVSVLYGAQYSGAVRLAFVLAIAGFLDMIGGVAANSMLGDGRTGTLLALDSFQTILIVLGTAYFVGSAGLLGAGYAVLLTSGSYAIVILVLLERSQRVELERVGASLVPAVGAFVVATAAIALGDAQANLWLASFLVAGSALVSWVSMASPERRLIRSVPRILLGRSVS